MSRLWLLQRLSAGFVTLALSCAGQDVSAQTAGSLWECVKTGGWGKSDAPAITVRFQSPAWSVCFANETGQSISYQKRWGPDPLDVHSVYPGQWRAHFCDPARATCILPFYVQFDAWQADSSRELEFSGMSLTTYQQRDDCMKCGLAASYAFVRKGSQITLEQRR